MQVIVTSTRTNTSIPVYCFVDSLANGCFMSEDVRVLLEGPSETGKESISVTTLGGEDKMRTVPIFNLSIRSVDGVHKLDLPVVYSVSKLPLDHDDIFNRSDLERWPHLHGLKHLIPELDRNIPVGIILGQNAPRALEPFDVIHGDTKNSPYAVQLMFGWTVCGPVTDEFEAVHKVNSIHVRTLFEMNNSRVVAVDDEKNKDSDLNSKFEKMYKLDYIEHSEPARSQEDIDFVEQLDRETKFENGHYVLPLPFRDSQESMPNNRHQAYSIAVSLRNRLCKPENKKLREQYIEYMWNLRKKGQMSKVPEDELATESGKVFYLTYHNVVNPQKPDKFRIVYHCSKPFEGTSLNQRLKPGPAADLTSSSLGVMIRFREEEEAFTADIEGFFNDTRLLEPHRDYQRFFWWDVEPGGSLQGPPEEFRFNTHLFGATSSPSVANYCLKRTALDNKDFFSEECVRTVMRNFYVDDLLRSVANSERERDLAKELFDICKRGGFCLRKFVATKPEILELIPPEFRAKSVENQEISVDKCKEGMAPEKTLGVLWNIENDTLCFRISFKDRPPTRRGLLSAVSSVWDLFGAASPFLLKGKRVLQELCRSKYGWDDILPDNIMENWKAWIASLHELRKIQLPRSFKPKGFGALKSAQLHVFSDASEYGYGVGMYVRLENVRGEIAVNLCLGKARVVPLDGETIPRSELVAATMAAELGSVVLSELEYPNVEVHHWTDSLVVIGYLCNTTKKFKSFVSNRIRRIKSAVGSAPWKHVPSGMNPGDDASRGLNPTKVNSEHRWFTGPAFLRLPENQWPNMDSKQEIPDVPDDDKEIKRTKPLICATEVSSGIPDVEESPILKIVNVDSDWFRMKHKIASLISYCRNRKTAGDGEKIKIAVTVELLEEAGNVIIRHLQKKHFGEHIRTLNSKKGTVNCAFLNKLDPFVDDSDGLLKVGGRLDNSKLDGNLVHPVVLPRFDVITDAIVRDCHQKVHHAGRIMTVNEIRRRGYWIIECNSKVKYVLRRCVTCRRLRGKFGLQKMASLPSDRTEVDQPMFTFVGVDNFGPIVVKEGRKEVKCYVALFTDLVARGVHLEVTKSLDTDDFICALRRFVNRRGPIRLLRSDNGGNFHGCENELTKSAIDEEKLKSFLQKEYGCDYEKGGIGFRWQFNTPLASNHGGVWERMIKTAREILNSILLKHPGHLTFESLRTLITEVEAIINSRPLTADVSDPENPLPLSPMSLLTQKSRIVLAPPGLFDNDASKYSRRQWRRIQHLAEEFWSRFRKEYLVDMNKRQKWTGARRNFQIGDIVIVKDDSVHRNDWAVAKIVEVFPDSKGFVRSVKLLMPRKDFRQQKTFLERPISKIVLLLETEETK